METCNDIQINRHELKVIVSGRNGGKRNMFSEQLGLFLRNYEEEIEASAKEVLTQKMPPLTEELFCLYETTGNRLKYEDVYFTRRKILAILGMRSLLGVENGWEDKPARPTIGRQIYLQKLEEVMEDICKEECWALPAHVRRVQDPHWRVTVDLFASETAQTLSEILVWLGEDLSARVREMVKENIERRIFQPYFTSRVPYASWEGGENNWNAVCAGSIGSACLHLMKEEPEHLSVCLERVMKSLTYYIEGFAEDGTCMEGLAYYYYGMTYFVNFAQELYDATEGKTDLFCGKWGEFKGGKDDRRYNIAHFPVKCFYPDGKSLSFSDGDIDGWFRVGVNSVLALHYLDWDNQDGKEAGSAAELFPDMSRAAGLHSDSCYRFAALKMDLTATRQLLEKLQEDNKKEDTAVKKPAAYILPAAQWYVAHSGADISFACKGGHNEEPHNHNDIGHFIYEGRGELFLTDLGAGEYTKDYFNEKRYETLCNNSFGHSVPIISGWGQEDGKEYGCSEFSADLDGHVSIELHNAYPEGVLSDFRREFCFDRESGKLQVKDNITFSVSEDGQTVTENLVTQIVPESTADGVLLKTEKGICIIETGQPKDCIEIKEYDHSNHQGEMEKVYAIQWPVAVDSGKAECSFSVTAEWK